MMEKRSYPNSGLMFKNLDMDLDRAELRKKGLEFEPADYKGNAEIDGIKYFLDGYIKTGDKGKFVSLKFKPKTEAKPRYPVKTRFDEDDPFL